MATYPHIERLVRYASGLSLRVIWYGGDIQWNAFLDRAWQDVAFERDRAYDDFDAVGDSVDAALATLDRQLKEGKHYMLKVSTTQEKERDDV